MKEWKQGDRLRCVHPDGAGKLSNGAIYTFNFLAPDGTVYLDEIRNVGFFTYRFEYVGPAIKQITISEELAIRVVRLIGIVYKETNKQHELDEAKSVLEELRKNDKS